MEMGWPPQRCRKRRRLIVPTRVAHFLPATPAPSGRTHCAVSLVQGMNQVEPFSLEDIFLHKTIRDVDCSPSGNLAVCTVASLDRSRDKEVSELWLFPLKEGEPSRLSTGHSTEKHIRWSPSGEQLAFISDRAGSEQLFPDAVRRRCRPAGGLPSRARLLRSNGGPQATALP
jgi:hypothetical protein